MDNQNSSQCHMKLIQALNYYRLLIHGLEPMPEKLVALQLAADEAGVDRGALAFELNTSATRHVACFSFKSEMLSEDLPDVYPVG